jgi:hypothetical protein
MEYLLYEMSRIDFSSLTLQIINSYFLMEELEKKKLSKKQPTAEVSTEQEVVDIKPRVGIEESSVIPEI